MYVYTSGSGKLRGAIKSTLASDSLPPVGEGLRASAFAGYLVVINPTKGGASTTGNQCRYFRPGLAHH